jgi:hypothetical protein
MLSWKLHQVVSTFTPGKVSVRYTVDLYDDALGFIGAQRFDVVMPDLLTAVYAAAEANLDAMRAQIGLDGDLPRAEANGGVDGIR